MRKNVLLSLTVCGFILASCVNVNTGPIESTAPPVEPSTLPSVTETQAPAAGLTSAVIGNSELFSPVVNSAIQMKDGKFSGVVEGIELTSMILPEIQFGDLNADGIDDAAFLLAEDTGGSATFISLIVVYSKDGQYAQAPGWMIDDRPILHSLEIDQGVVKVAGLIHGPNDSMVNPTTEVKQEYLLFTDHLVITRFTSAFQGGAEHAILLDTPKAGEIISDPIHIAGSMPIGPFENNISLSVTDEQGNQIYQSGFMVDAADMGAPATFDSQVAISGLVSGSRILLALEELSMADGTPIAINAVVLTVK